jgi:glycosyltransferase involved in cell wall biosynthesis
VEPGINNAFQIAYDDVVETYNALTNVGYIKRIYLNKVLCKRIHVTPPPVSVRVFGYDPAKVQSEVNNGYILTYYEQSWQKPVITEYGIYQLFVEQQNLPYNYFAFPWAQYIDNKWRRDNSLNLLLDRYIEERIVDVSYCTVIQHKDYRDLLPLFQRLGIHIVFAVHFCKEDRGLAERYSMTLLPMSLYPIHNGEGLPIAERKYLTSFIGQYDPKKYISDIRVKIFDMFPKYADCYIVRRKLWHFQSTVFKNVGETAHPECEKEYKDLLADSRFSLCPSGSGANSIRLWESLSYGSVPVLLADTYILPEIKGLDWKDVLIFWKEADIDSLYDHLKTYDLATLEKMSKAGIALYHEYFSTKKFNRIILEFFNS